MTPKTPSAPPFEGQAAPRYVAEETGGCGAWRVMDERDGTEVCVCSGDTDPRNNDEPRRDARADAEMIAAILNAKENAS